MTLSYEINRPAFPRITILQITVLTPYLAQLRELRDALNGRISNEDAADVAAAMREGQEEPSNDVKSEEKDKAAHPLPDLRSKIRVATGKIAWTIGTPFERTWSTMLTPADTPRIPNPFLEIRCSFHPCLTESASHACGTQRPVDVCKTVDNYQGEENDLIIGSFVRSNIGGLMGFVGDPNRLNVAISRARCGYDKNLVHNVCCCCPCLLVLISMTSTLPSIFYRQGMILFGDIDFFTSDTVKNKHGQHLWLRFQTLLEAGGHLYREGLPVACETHKTTADLPSPEDFDKYAPDGGCRAMCSAKLSCAENHPCPRRWRTGPFVALQRECVYLIFILLGKYFNCMMKFTDLFSDKSAADWRSRVFRKGVKLIRLIVVRNQQQLGDVERIASFSRASYPRSHSHRMLEAHHMLRTKF